MGKRRSVKNLSLGQSEDHKSTYALLHEVLVQDLADDGPAHGNTSRVTNPSVELSVRLVRDQHTVPKEVARRLCLLGEGDHVGRRAEVPMRVAPELARRAEAGLHLVYDESDVVLLGDVA